MEIARQEGVLVRRLETFNILYLPDRTAPHN